MHTRNAFPEEKTIVAKKIITVHNAENEPDTSVELIVSNKIDYIPNISVVIPVYNVEDYLRECLDSVLNQTLREIEIICVDDGSTDDSMEILKEYAAVDNRITVVKQDNLNAGVARNAGLVLAKAKYITFLDSDDFFELSMLEECYDRLERDSSDICIYSGQKIDYSVNKILDMPWLCPKEDSILDIDELKGDILNRTSSNCWNKIFSRDIIDAYHIRFQSIENANDVYFSYLAVAVAKKVSVLPKKFVNYRFNTGKQITARLSHVSPLNIFYALSKLKKDIVSIKGESFLTDGFYRKYIGMLIYQRKNNFLGFEANKTTYKELFPSDRHELFDNTFKSAAIVCAANQRCVKSLWISIAAIQKNLPKDTTCRLFILHDKLSERIKTKISRLATEATSIEFINGSEHLKNLGLPEYADGTREMYYKYLIPQIFRNDEKVLYIDYSTEVCGDVLQLFQIDLKENVIATVVNKQNSASSKSSNAGLYMFNIPAWNRLKLTQKILAEISEFSRSHPSDQDILNKICAGQIASLPCALSICYPPRNHRFYNLLKSYLLCPYCVLRQMAHKKKYIKKLSIRVINSLSVMRIDVKNAGTDQNAVSIDATGAKITSPSWFTDSKGIGKVVESTDSKLDITINIVKSGKLTLNFRGVDKRYNGKRFPVWIDYKSIQINGKEILTAPISVWHDKPFQYEMAVKDKQNISVKIEQSYHPYNKEELREIISKLSLGSQYEQPDIIKKVYQKLSRKGIGHFLFHKTKNDRCKKYFLCGIRIWKKNVSMYNYLDLRISQLAHTEAKNVQALRKEIQDYSKKNSTTINDHKTDLFKYIDAKFLQLEVRDNDHKAYLLKHIAAEFLQLEVRDNSQNEKLLQDYSGQLQKLYTEIASCERNVGDLFCKQLAAHKDDSSRAHLATQDMLREALNEIQEQKQQHKYQTLIKEVEQKIQDLNSYLDKKIKDRANDIITAVEREQVLYSNPFEIMTRLERGFCDITDAPNFANRFIKLIAGLSPKSAGALVDIVNRLKMIKNSKGKLDLFYPHEKDILREIRAYYKSILKVSDNLYCLNNYLLPINHFEPSVFFYRHGLDTLKHPERFANKAILDIGAFIGDSAIILSPLTSDKVYSFEATTENYNYMLKTIKLNNLKNIVPIKAAVGAEPSTMELRFAGSGTSYSPLMVKSPKYMETCEVIKIDDYVQENHLKVGLIKVDIEGAEQEFLKGAMQTIKEQKPTLLISIYHSVDDFLDIKPLIESWNLGYNFSIYKPIIDNISGETLLICEQ